MLFAQGINKSLISTEKKGKCAVSRERRTRLINDFTHPVPDRTSGFFPDIRSGIHGTGRAFCYRFFTTAKQNTPKKETGKNRTFLFVSVCYSLLSAVFRSLFKIPNPCAAGPIPAGGISDFRGLCLLHNPFSVRCYRFVTGFRHHTLPASVLIPLISGVQARCFPAFARIPDLQVS